MVASVSALTSSGQVRRLIDVARAPPERVNPGAPIGTRPLRLVPPSDGKEDGKLP